jgi:hypothetical protein
MADKQAWPRETRPLWAGLKVCLIIALLLQLVLIAPSAYELWYGVLSADELAQNLPALGIMLGGAALGIIMIFVYFLCIIYTARITFRMMKNLDSFNVTNARMGPAMTVIWYFIPFANLVMPYRGFQQIREGTFEAHPGTPPSDDASGLWWGTWILSNIIGTASFRMSLEAGGMSEYGPTDIGLYNLSLWLGIGSSVIGALSCWFMIRAFGPVARAQDEIIRTRVTTG